MAYEISIATTMCISVIWALSLNIIVGFCGQISLGHAAFMGIGAYTAAILSTNGVTFAPAIAAGIVLASLFGLLVGFCSLRVRADFLAITTMGVGFLFIGIVRQQDALGGEEGIFGIADPGFGNLGYAFLVAGFAALTILLSLYLKKSWLGYVFEAIAEDEDTTTVLGIDTARYKLTAFVIGTGLAGLAGGLYAFQVRFIGIDSFTFVESITVLAMVIVGGIGTVWGVATAAAVLSALPLWLDFIADYKIVFFGGLLVLVMYFSPDGISGLMQRFHSLITRANRAEAQR